MWMRTVTVIKHDDNKHRKSNENLGMEKELELVINGVKNQVFSLTPNLEKEAMVGYLKSKAFISGMQDIEKITVDSPLCSVSLKSGQQQQQQQQQAQTEVLSLPAAVIFQLTASFQEKSMLYKDVSISHSAALATPKQIVYFAEDLSRKNAWYKTLGLCVSKEQPAPSILMLSGKIDAWIVEEAKAIGARMVISRLGPTDKAYQNAKDNNITIIGFARGTRYTQYL